jgi:hypothetical protein
MKLTATQLRSIIREEVKRTKRLHEAPELDAGLIKQDMVSILNAYEGLNDHLSGDLEDGSFEELMRDIFSAKSLLEDLLDNAEELRGLHGSNKSPTGYY